MRPLRLFGSGLFSSGLLSLAILASASAWAQGDAPIEVFGYFQAQFLYENVDEDRDLVVQSLGPLGGERRDSDVTSFNLQQLNLFLRRPLTPKTTAFVDLELVN
ncbi:MAG: hypothetical protein AAGG50_01790, partial [Bacteroidota bacterium]